MTGHYVSRLERCQKGIVGGLIMWQSLGRNLKGLLTAVCLLTFALCAIEIALRLDRYQSTLQCQPSIASADLPLRDQLLAPSVDIWSELLPNSKVTLTSPDSREVIEFRTNSFGARGAEPVVPKPAGLIRVLCLGDETTLAPELPEGEAYPASLQSLLSQSLGAKVEVINAGIPGNCPRLIVLQIKHRLMALQPDLVIVHFDMSDVAEDSAIRRFVTLDRKGDPILATHPATRKACQLRAPRLADEFLLIQTAERQLTQWWAKESQANEESSIAARQRYRWIDDAPPEMDDEINSALAPLAVVHRLCTIQGAKLLVSTTPKPWQVSPKASPTREARAVNGIPRDACWKSTAPFKRLAAMCKSSEIPYVIPLSAFLKAPKPEKLFLTHSPGLSPLGHQLYAQVLEKVIGGGALQIVPEPASSEIIQSHAEDSTIHPQPGFRPTPK